MEFKIIYPDHSHIGGVVSFELVELDPYEKMEPTGKSQLFLHTVPTYHIDYGKRLDFERPELAMQDFIIRELERGMKELLFALRVQMIKDKFVVFENGLANPPEIKSFPYWFTIK